MPARRLREAMRKEGEILRLEALVGDWRQAKAKQYKMPPQRTRRQKQLRRRSYMHAGLCVSSQHRCDARNGARHKTKVTEGEICVPARGYAAVFACVVPLEVDPSRFSFLQSRPLPRAISSLPCALSPHPSSLFGGVLARCLCLSKHFFDAEVSIRTSGSRYAAFRETSDLSLACSARAKPSSAL